MKLKNLVFLGLLFFVACSPLRHLKKVEAVIMGPPPVQIMSAQPNPKPEYLDPMFYSPYFVETILEEMEAAGISTKIANPRESLAVKDPNKIILDLGMVSIEDTRGMPGDANRDDEPKGLKLTIIGGFGSVNKKGESVANNKPRELFLAEDEIAKYIKEDPLADPIKIILKKAAATFSKELQTDVIKHVKKNG